MTYEVILDSDECVSAGRCVNTAGDFFVFDADEIGSINRAADQPDDTMLLRIARQCPSGAIKLRLDGEDVEI
jgi:ferredoxin